MSKSPEKKQQFIGGNFAILGDQSHIAGVVGDQVDQQAAGPHSWSQLHIHCGKNFLNFESGIFVGLYFCKYPILSKLSLFIRTHDTKLTRALSIEDWALSIEHWTFEEAQKPSVFYHQGSILLRMLFAGWHYKDWRHVKWNVKQK